jgi:hypothetical protein
MQNCEILVPLGWAIIIVSTITIIVPIVRGRGDAATFWNIFLMGGIVFIGIGCLEVVYGSFDWPQLQWFQPTRKEVQIFVIGTILFYTSAFTSYFLLSKPLQRFTGRFLNKWPPNSLTLTLSIVAAALAVTVGTFLFEGVFYLGPLFANISQKIVIFAVVFTFCHWFENKRQLPMLALFIGVFVYCGLFSMVTYVGRRMLMSIIAAPLFCMYWLKWRYKSPKYILMGMALAGAFVFLAIGFYSSFRHAREIYGTQANRSFANVVKAITSTSLSDEIEYLKRTSLHFFSQYTVHYSLLTIHLVESHEVEVEPLNTVQFLVTYPFPRALWPGKPASLGVRMVNDVLRLNVATNWGLGIVGHGWHEGGYLVIMLYGFLIVVVIRLMDDAMRRHPDNRFLLATLVAGAPHILAWTRGDTFSMSAEIMEAFAFVWILGIAGRFMFGTDSQQGRGTAQPPFEPMVGQPYRTDQ